MTDKKKILFDEISKLDTEQVNENSKNIDRQSISEILKIINDEDKKVPKVIEKVLPEIEIAVNSVVESIKKGGRLLYFGAGTSGRLGVVDASECPPTFGTDPNVVQGFIAGGKEAMFVAQEGAEDFEENGEKDVIKANVSDKDVVCGIAASKRTPYVLGAIKKAKKLGAKTVFVSCVSKENFNFPEVDIPICAYVGPEVIMGSTRMKSGTAQKLILNMITTTAMVKLGKTYQNMMIDLQHTNLKLVERSKRIIMMITGVDYNSAEIFLNKANGHVKTALVMILANVDFNEAKKKLVAADGFVREAVLK